MTDMPNHIHMFIDAGHELECNKDEGPLGCSPQGGSQAKTGTQATEVTSQLQLASFILGAILNVLLAYEAISKRQSGGRSPSQT